MQYITKEGASITEAFLVTLTCPEKMSLLAFYSVFYAVSFINPYS